MLLVASRQHYPGIALNVNILRPRRNGRRFADDISNAFPWKHLVYIDQNFTEICFQGTNQQAISGSDNSLASIRRQGFIWIIDGLAYWRIYASLGLDELKVLVNLKARRMGLKFSCCSEIWIALLWWCCFEIWLSSVNSYLEISSHSPLRTFSGLSLGTHDIKVFSFWWNNFSLVKRCLVTNISRYMVLLIPSPRNTCSHNYIESVFFINFNAIIQKAFLVCRQFISIV